MSDNKDQMQRGFERLSNEINLTGKKIAGYIDGVPFIVNENENFVLPNSNEDFALKTNFESPLNDSPEFPTVESPFTQKLTDKLKYESPFGDNSVFAEKNNYWLGDKIREEEKKKKEEIENKALEIERQIPKIIPLIRQNANQDTNNLYNNLFKLIHPNPHRNNKTLLGIQDTLLYGRDWYSIQVVSRLGPVFYKSLYHSQVGSANFLSNELKSDFSDTVKLIDKNFDYPTVFGWDIGELEKPHTDYGKTKAVDKDFIINATQPQVLLKCIKWVYDNGGVNTISWHCMNPENNKKFVFPDLEYSKKGTVKLLLQEKDNFDKNPKTKDAEIYKRYTQWLNYVIDFLQDPLIANIPIIFRPLHEANIDGVFWWAGSSCDAADYIKLWKLIVDTFQQRQVKNILFAYSINDFLSETATSPDETVKRDFVKIFNERYPGDDYVDIIGIDFYNKEKSDKAKNSYTTKINQYSNILNEIAIQKSKVAAITETGVLRLQNFDNKTKQNDTFTKCYQPMFENNKVAYALIWQNSKGENAEYFSCSPKPNLNNNSFNDFNAFFEKIKASLMSTFSRKELYKSTTILLFFLFLSFFTKAQNIDSTLLSLKLDSTISLSDLKNLKVVKNQFLTKNNDRFAFCHKIKRLNNDAFSLCITNSHNYLETVIEVEYTDNFKYPDINMNGETRIECAKLTFLPMNKVVKIINFKVNEKNISKLVYLLQWHNTHRAVYGSSLDENKIKKLASVIIL